MKVKFSKDPEIRKEQEKILRIGKDTVASRKRLELETDKAWEERKKKRFATGIKKIQFVCEDEKIFNVALEVFGESPAQELLQGSAP